jgi:hypothetical protein
MQKKALTHKTRCKKVLQIHLCNLFANATNKGLGFRVCSRLGGKKAFSKSALR